MNATVESPPPMIRNPESAGDTPAATATAGKNGATLVQDVPLAEIVRSPFNRTVDTKTPQFAELVDSIRQYGVIQPGIGRPLTLDFEPRIELVIGEHRWLGSLAADRATMPLIVRQLTDVQVVELQTIENDKRKDLSPIEEAEKYQQLIDQYGKAGATKEAAIARLCEKLSKGKSTVYEALRLLKLAGPVKEMVHSGQISPSQAGLIAQEKDPAKQVALIKESLGKSFRETKRVTARRRTGVKPDVAEAQIERARNLGRWLTQNEDRLSAGWRQILDPIFKLYRRKWQTGHAKSPDARKTRPTRPPLQKKT